MTRDYEGRRRSEREETREVAPTPGKVANTDLLHRSLAGPMPTVLGKLSAVEARSSLAPRIPGRQTAAESLPSQRGSGLPPELRARFERSLGVDLGNVRVHAGTDAAERADAAGAHAFATGDDIVLGRGVVLGTPDGDRVLAEEVAHTVQQRGASRASTELPITSKGEDVENEADRAARAMLFGAPATVSASPLAIARSPNPDAIIGNAAKYLYLNARQAGAAIQQHFASVTLPPPHPRLTWNDRDAFLKALYQILNATVAERILKSLGPDEGPVRSALAARQDDAWRISAALQTFEASSKWTDLQNKDTGAGHVFLGDEANLEAIRTAAKAPEAPKHWIVAGTGGTAISAVEIILDANRTAKVTMLGRDSPAGLFENDQFRAVAKKNLHREDAKRLGLKGIPGVEGGRLHIVVNEKMNLGAPEARDVRGGREYVGWKDASGKEYAGDGYVAALGRELQVPPIVSELIMRARREHGDKAVRYVPQYHEGHYVGYTIHINYRGRLHSFDVTGAVSRSVPRATLAREGRDGKPIPPQPSSDPAGLNVEATERVERSSSLDAPSASGNFDGGYVASAIQAWRYAMNRLMRGGS